MGLIDLWELFDLVSAWDPEILYSEILPFICIVPLGDLPRINFLVWLQSAGNQFPSDHLDDPVLV